MRAFVLAAAFLGCGTTTSETNDFPSGQGDASPDSKVDQLPVAPANLERWISGNVADADVQANGPGLVLMGGSTDVDEAFEWVSSKVSGGDLVVLRTSGSDGYNDYLFQDIGGFDSIETLKVTSRQLADDPYVAWTVAHAEAVFMAGGDQATYVEYWSGTALSAALAEVWERGGILGGTSAGCAVLGEHVFSAENGTVYPEEAMEDPYNPYMTLAPTLVSPAVLPKVITDTHFRQRDRMGRLITFVGRLMVDGQETQPIGLGVDERTALLVEDGIGTVVGEGAVYAVIPSGEPEKMLAGEAVEFAGVPVYSLTAGDSIDLDTGVTDLPAISVSVTAGATLPSDPY